MAIPLLNSSNALPVPHDDGSWHSEEISRVIECIREYSDRLDVRYIPEHLREEGDAAFAITEHLADGREVVAFYVQTEAEMNLSVLERIHMGDNAKHNVDLARQAKNEAANQLRRKRHQDAISEMNEEAAWMFATNKHTIRRNGKKIDL